MVALLVSDSGNRKKEHRLDACQDLPFVSDSRH